MTEPVARTSTFPHRAEFSPMLHVEAGRRGRADCNGCEDTCGLAAEACAGVALPAFLIDFSSESRRIQDPYRGLLGYV